MSTDSAMSVESKESFWLEHQESLKRIRSHLVKGRKGPIKQSTPVRKNRSPAADKTSTQYLIPGPGSPAARGHAPYGKYRRTPPPVLPRLQTPPEHNHFKDSKNLRKEKYEIVPPVKPKQAFIHTRTPDHDSWGEESDESSDDDADVPHPLPFNAQYMTPAPVMFGQPFPVFYPPPPKGASRTGRHFDRKRRRSPEKGYGDMYRSRRQHVNQPVRNSRRNKTRSKRPGRHSMPVQNTFPMAYPTGYPGTMTNGYPVPMLNTYMIPVQNGHVIDDDEKGVRFEKPKYKYIYPRNADSEEEDEDYESVVGDELPPEHPYYIPALYVCEEFLGDEVENMVRDVIRESMNEVVDNYLGDELLKRDPLEDWLNQLVDDAVHESCREIVRESVMDLAQDYLEEQTVYNIYIDLISDHVQSIGNELLDDCLFDMVAGDFLDEHVIGPEVDEECFAVATDVIKHYDNKVTQQQLKAIRHQAGEKLVDSLCLEYILSLVSRQGKVWTESDFANKYLDDMMTNLLLEQYFGVKNNRNKTLHCRPLRKLHEKVVTDVAMDVLLQQVSASLDEDLADVDEYERGINDNVIHKIPTVVR